jgi:hypothetical protein
MISLIATIYTHTKKKEFASDIASLYLEGIPKTAQQF